MKTKLLTGKYLDYWVGLAIGLVRDGEGWKDGDYPVPSPWSPSTRGNDGIQLIGREKIALIPTLVKSNEAEDSGHWVEGYQAMHEPYCEPGLNIEGDHQTEGHTALIAAMRCIVLAKYGEEVDDVVLPDADLP